jgi:conjugative relaxase-like TrwC/TraI family protein
MLSIGSIKSASGAASYYAKDNYYTENSAQDASIWFGKGAEALGLEGPVEPAAFEAILAGKLPNGEQIAAGGNGKRCGFDLTFSAPKSLSLIALVGGDQRLIDAHDKAVKAALNFAELAEHRFCLSQTFGGCITSQVKRFCSPSTPVIKRRYPRSPLTR